MGDIKFKDSVNLKDILGNFNEYDEYFEIEDDFGSFIRIDKKVEKFSIMAITF